MKVSELSGAALDAAVEKALGLPPDLCGFVPAYSASWEHGGPIIEREKIHVFHGGVASEMAWQAYAHRGAGAGPTPLIAAMRAFVASKFGEEDDLMRQEARMRERFLCSRLEPCSLEDEARHDAGLSYWVRDRRSGSVLLICGGQAHLAPPL